MGSPWLVRIIGFLGCTPCFCLRSFFIESGRRCPCRERLGASVADTPPVKVGLLPAGVVSQYKYCYIFYDTNITLILYSAIEECDYTFILLVASSKYVILINQNYNLKFSNSPFTNLRVQF